MGQVDCHREDVMITVTFIVIGVFNIIAIWAWPGSDGTIL